MIWRRKSITITRVNNATLNSRRIDTSFCSKIQGKDDLFCVTMFTLNGMCSHCIFGVINIYYVCSN
jgi:hypothetical protein